MAIRPAACEHAGGPTFRLSERDRAALHEQIRQDQDDPRLEGLVCVGWYVSHTRTEIALTESDQEIFSSLFRPALAGDSGGAAEPGRKHARRILCPGAGRDGKREPELPGVQLSGPAGGGLRSSRIIAASSPSADRSGTSPRAAARPRRGRRPSPPVSSAGRKVRIAADGADSSAQLRPA